MSKTNNTSKLLAQPAFIIYDASAGSGKTYTLVRDYLMTVLENENPRRYQSVLAITFTNKAAQEMKTRILDQLNQFSSPEILNSPTELFQNVAQHCNLNAKELHHRASNLLFHLLQHYGHFSITTIDSLTHQIVRTFSRDLGLSSTFELFLETDQFLEQAVDFLIEQAGDNDELTKTLKDFVIQKASQDKSWDIAYDLNKIASLVYNENHYNELRQISDKGWNEFSALGKVIRGLRHKHIKKLNTSSKALAEKVRETQVDESLFSHGELIKQLEKAQAKEITKIPSPRLVSLNDKGQLLKKTASQSDQNALAAIQNEIDEWIYTTTLAFKELALLNAIEAQRVPFSTLHAIYQTTQLLQDKQDKRLLSGFNALISQTIKDAPAPFIYERLGVKYKNIYIDEFQDTSILQWTNLIPLAENALSNTESSVLLVGDAKQSIYRWRGGYPEQFIRLSKGDSPFATKPKVTKLPINFRSHDNIVITNNSFFKEVATQVKDPNYQNLFIEGTNQKTSNKKGGWVTFSFVEGDSVDDRKQSYLESTYTRVLECFDRGYTHSDICVLVRTKKQGVLVTEFLTQKELPVVSAETLLLAQNKQINLLVSLIRLRVNHADEVARKAVLDYFRPSDKDPYSWYKSGVKNSVGKLIDEINKQGYAFSFNSFLQKDLYEATEYAIDCFKMAASFSPYLLGFLEEIVEQSINKVVSDKNFLSYWNEAKSRLSIRLPEMIEAVQVMTIHKAKGLEFPIVIFPFAESKLYDIKSAKHWLSVDDDKYAGFSSLLVSLNKGFSETSDENQTIYETAKDMAALDALNTLYVAMTRPEKELHILSYQPKKASQSYADLFVNYVSNESVVQRKENQYTVGEPLVIKSKPSKTKTVKEGQWVTNPNLEVVFRHNNQFANKEQNSAINFGHVFHEIMSRIYVKTDIEQAVQHAYNQGKISADQTDNLQTLISKIVTHKELNHFFTSNHQQYNERSLLRPNGPPLRPDCFVILPNKKVAILDYKTGKYRPEHEHQLLEYSSFFEKTGYVVCQKTLIYLDKRLTLKHI